MVYLRYLRYGLWLFAAGAIALYGLLWLDQKFDLSLFNGGASNQNAALPAPSFTEFAQMKGDFSVMRVDNDPSLGNSSLADPDGLAFTQQDLLGKYSVVYFGFTHCPDICPATLYQMNLWKQDLGALADAFQFLFVTVDPKRDDAALMRDYTAAFSSNIIPLTGTQAQIDKLLDIYKVTAKFVPLEDGDYTVDHTASIYLLDKGGNFHSLIAHNEPYDMAIAKLKRIAAD
ncbi:MAG: SCO family protein [Alphaproteobacteria bacterium]